MRVAIPLNRYDSEDLHDVTYHLVKQLDDAYQVTQQLTPKRKFCNERSTSSVTRGLLQPRRVNNILK